MWFSLLNFNILFSLFVKLFVSKCILPGASRRLLAGGESLSSLAFLVKSDQGDKDWQG
jgi:hypothetical protein